MSENMKKLVNKSINKNRIMKEEIRNEQKKREDEENQRKIDKEIYNNDIRKRNTDKFTPKVENTNFKRFPWNFDQQKLKEFYVNVYRQEERKMNKNQKVVKEDERRRKLGLGFLNGYNDKQIGKIKQNQKSKELQIQ